MINKLEMSVMKKKELEDRIFHSNPILTTLMENQVSLEKRFQEILKFNKVKTVTVNSASKIDFIPIHEIVYCRANLAYTEIMPLNKKCLTSTKPINEFEELLNLNYFFRISRSLLINLNQIQSYNKKTGKVTMKDNTILNVSRRKKAEFLLTILK